MMKILAFLLPFALGCATTKSETVKDNVVRLTVTEDGFQPDNVRVKKGQPVKLIVTRTTNHTCATEIVLSEYDINAPLPLNQPVELSFTPTESGKLKYGCAMKMVGGVIFVD